MATMIFRHKNTAIFFDPTPPFHLFNVLRIVSLARLEWQSVEQGARSASLGVPKILGLCLATCFLAGCSTGYAVWTETTSTALTTNKSAGVSADCREKLGNFRLAVSSAGTGDVENRRIRGYEYLRINRFYAHLGRQFENSSSGPAFDAWVDHLRALDAEATRIEIANLPKNSVREVSRQLLGKTGRRDAVLKVVEDCSERLRATELSDRNVRRHLLSRANVGDNYSDVARFVGLFPLTTVPVGIGWEKWKKDNLTTFDKPLSELPVLGRVIEFAPSNAKRPLTPSDVRAIIDRSRDRKLGIPLPNAKDQKRLFQNFAPIWQVDVTGDYDEIGYPTWGDQGNQVVVDHSRPTVFTRISHVIVDNAVLLQLNYSVWFKERPLSGPLDALGGNVDGVIWRVTLGKDGRPLLYDSIHACGCYHLLFPSKPLRERQNAQSTAALKEVPGILDNAPTPAGNKRVVLRLATKSHYLSGVSVSGRRLGSGAHRTVKFVDDNRLRSLVLSRGERRSLYGDDGLISGTERLERVALWPTGVVSPGAMRQWGHHATAFVDRRHFDDPDLIEKVFGN